jgi:hypothetical protein
VNQDRRGQGKDQIDPKDFLLKDYEIKVSYLSNHFQRMWTRFNFFVVIESALIGGRFIAGDGKLTAELVIVGAVLSLVWYIFGAQDRWLVTRYRTQAEEAAMKAANQAGGIAQSDYHFATGSTVVRAGGRERPQKAYISPAEWRYRPLSVTRLAAVVPAFTFLIWVSLFLVLVTGWPALLAKALE